MAFLQVVYRLPIASKAGAKLALRHDAGYDKLICATYDPRVILKERNDPAIPSGFISR